MKILLLCDKPPWPGDSGGAIATQSMIRDIIASGNVLDIMFLKTAKHNGGIRDIPSDISGKFSAVSVDHQNTPSVFKAIINLLFSKRPYNLERFKSGKALRMLDQLLFNTKYDIVQFEGMATCNYYQNARAASGAKLVMRSHNAEHEIWQGLSGETGNPFKKAYYRILAGRIWQTEKNQLDLYDGLVTISDADLGKFRNMGIQTPAVTIFPSFEAIKKGQQFSGEKLPAIGYIGSLDWIPNVYGLKWFLGEVWPLVRQKVPGVRFIIGGRNPDRSLLKAIELSGAEYAGYPDSSTDFINSVSLVAVPLFSGSGIRIKIIESLLAGTMVVTTPKGAEGIPAEIASMIPVTDNAVQMSVFIIQYLTRNNKSFKFNSKLRDRVDQIFCSNAPREKLTDFYRSITNDN